MGADCSSRAAATPAKTALKSPCPPRRPNLARALLAQPEVKPIGLGARNSLRLEAGLCLYGNDIDTTTTPVEAALNWAMQKVRRTGGARAGGFPGADKVLAQLTTRADGAQARGPGGPGARARARAHRAAEPRRTAFGEVTSGLLGPTINKPIAMGYVRPHAAMGTRLSTPSCAASPCPWKSCHALRAHRYYRG
jgi:aminomethyltransferase